uniref:Candidate secreted effector n=1 Tax=Meloidogyne incognita TaxID=6306 RepID=A0A914MIA5_MELIC
MQLLDVLESAVLLLLTGEHKKGSYASYQVAAVHYVSWSQTSNLQIGYASDVRKSTCNKKNDSTAGNKNVSIR